jgi:hypothetical protein
MFLLSNPLYDLPQNRVRFMHPVKNILLTHSPLTHRTQVNQITGMQVIVAYKQLINNKKRQISGKDHPKTSFLHAVTFNQ